MPDPMNAIGEAELAIAARKKARESMALEHRGALPHELFADEMTRLHAEAKTLRYLFATYAARPR
jgi:hypothetical protein